MQTLCTVVGVVTLLLVSLTCAIGIFCQLRQPSRWSAIQSAEAESDRRWRGSILEHAKWLSEDREIYWLLERIADDPHPEVLREEWRARRKRGEDE